MQMERKQIMPLPKTMYSSFQPKLSLSTESTGNEQGIMQA